MSAEQVAAATYPHSYAVGTCKNGCFKPFLQVCSHYNTVSFPTSILMLIGKTQNSPESLGLQGRLRCSVHIIIIVLPQACGAFL